MWPWARRTVSHCWCHLKKSKIYLCRALGRKHAAVQLASCHLARGGDQSLGRCGASAFNTASEVTASKRTTGTASAAQASRNGQDWGGDRARGRGWLQHLLRCDHARYGLDPCLESA